jgi:hypothetical protein
MQGGPAGGGHFRGGRGSPWQGGGRGQQWQGQGGGRGQQWQGQGGGGGFGGGQFHGGQGQGPRIQLNEHQLAAIAEEIRKLTKACPMEWENPFQNFQPIGTPKNMFDFDPQLDLGLFERLQYWTDCDQTLNFKKGMFMSLQDHINPKTGPPHVQGIRIQKATIQQIKDFFTPNVRSEPTVLSLLWSAHITPMQPGCTQQNIVPVGGLHRLSRHDQGAAFSVTFPKCHDCPF